MLPPPPIGADGGDTGALGGGTEVWVGKAGIMVAGVNMGVLVGWITPTEPPPPLGGPGGNPAGLTDRR